MKSFEDSTLQIGSNFKPQPMAVLKTESIQPAIKTENDESLITRSQNACTQSFHRNSNWLVSSSSLKRSCYKEGVGEFGLLWFDPVGEPAPEPAGLQIAKEIREVD